VDGEYLGPLPVRFTVTDALLQIVVPKEFPSPPDSPDHLAGALKGLGGKTPDNHKVAQTGS
jgi:hypothetical protein